MSEDAERLLRFVAVADPSLANRYETVAPPLRRSATVEGMARTTSRVARLLAGALAGLEHSAEHETRGVVLLGGRERIEFASPPARRLLRDFFPAAVLPLPVEVSDWLAARSGPLVVDRRDRRLRIDCVGDALLLEESSVGAGLTRREQEVLAWVARGKTNAEIAETLWLSPGTVRKHLENAFAKLGVRTRTAAVARFNALAGDAEDQSTRPAQSS